MTKHATLASILIGPICAFILSGCSSDAEPEIAAASELSEAVGADIKPGDVCTIVNASVPLPEQLSETSGLAQSREDAGIFWTHNDSGDNPELFAIDTEGQIAGRIDIAGATFEDWEDIEAGSCDSGNCLFIADTGDNDEEREFVTIYKIAEPSPEANAPVMATALNVRYPSGSRDAESLFVLPNGDIYLITKGRYAPISLFRYPAPQNPAVTATLEHVRDLAPLPENNDGRVTGATASADGKWVAVRTSNELRLYQTDEFVTSATAEPMVFGLGPLGEPQGEAVAFGDGASIWLTSEAGSDDQLPSWSQLSCTLRAN